MVNELRVFDIVRMTKKNANEMLRKLFFLIVGKDNLRKMTATGKTREPIPENIYKAVQSI